jgi:PAS domain S-box/PAS domain S-box
MRHKIATNHPFIFLMNSIKDLIVCLSLDGKILCANTAFEKFTGSEKIKITGQHFKVFLEKLHLDILATKKIADILPNLPIVDLEYNCKHHNNSNHDVLWSFLPLLSTNETPDGLILIGRDITEYKKLSAQIERLDNIIRYAPDWIYWKDRNSTHLGCNDQFSRAAGLQHREDIIGKSDSDLPWSENAHKYNLDDQEVIESGEAKINIEDAVPLQNGKVAIVISNKVPLRDSNGQVIGVLGIATDITERKHIEEDLRKSKEAAEAASRAKTMFLANMSHDIKTPIAGIISTAEYLAHSIENIDNKSLANDIVQSGMRLLELMIELIEISRLEVKETSNNNIRFKPKQLIDDIIQLIKPAIVNKSLALNVQYDDNIPDFLFGNRWHLYRVVLNLISNALKFTSAGHITTNIALIKKTKKEAIIKVSIEDTGIGIPKDKLTIIFDEFTRLTPSYEGIYKGTGLGLYIVKQFIQSMKGEVYVESKEGKGSTFTCIIPLKIPPAHVNNNEENSSAVTIQGESATFNNIVAFSGPNSEISENEKLNVTHLPDNIKMLLVEDNVIAARTTKAILQSLDCVVDVANCGKEAIDLFEPGKYNLIYMDIGLPDINGNQVTEKIREIEGTTEKKVPIIALSAHVDANIKATCIKCGMNDVLSKPLLRDKAQQVIKTFISIESRSHLTNHQNTNPIDEVSEELKIIDLELGASIINSDINNAKEALKMLIDTLPENLQKMQAAYNAKNIEELAKSAHYLHGGLSYCGAPKLRKAVKTLETLIRSGNLDQLDLLYQNFCLEIEALIDAYEHL